MQRLIDAVELKKHAYCDDDIFHHQIVDVSDIDAAPTVDAVPVEWIRNYMAKHGRDSLALMLAEWINEQPTVDSVRVVRCKDCKYWRKFGKDMICEAVCADPYETWASEANDYCSLGERKEVDSDEAD